MKVYRDIQEWCLKEFGGDMDRMQHYLKSLYDNMLYKNELSEFKSLRPIYNKKLPAHIILSVDEDLPF